MQKRQSVDVLSVLQFVFSGLAVLILLGTAAGLALTGVASKVGDASSTGSVTPLFLLTVSAALLGLLMIPSTATALMRMLGKPVSTRPFLRNFRPVIAFTPLMWVLSLLAGNWISNSVNMEWLLLPPLHLLAIGLPIVWLLALALRDLPVGSAQRRWGSFSTGAVGSTILSFLLEAVVGLVLLVVAGVYASTRPELLAEMNRLVQRLSMVQENPDAILRILSPLVQKPEVALVALIYLAGMVPLIEELVKPLAAWLLFRRRLTPTDGFVVGLICGAGFALAESLGTASAVTGAQWLVVVAARSGTGLMHMLTAGLTGWALASTWRDGKVLRLVGAYLLAVLLHAAWNFTSLLMSVQAIINVSPTSSNLLLNASRLAPYGLVVLMAVMLALLLRMNAHLRREMLPQNPTL